MRFNLIDRIFEVRPGQAIKAAKNLTLGEEYLADHFPTFPVMPGVLMLQALVEAGAWLLRATEDFRHAVVTLRDARNVKYGHFMEPGKRLVVGVEWLERTETTATFKDKVALVTGGARGIGRAIVQAFAAEGARVAAVYRGSRDAADALVKEVRDAGGTALAIQCDVADHAAVKGCVERVAAELGPIDI